MSMCFARAVHSRTTLLLPVLFSACQILGPSDEPGLVFDTDRNAYTPGDEVILTLTNYSSRSVIVHPNLCGAALQHWYKSGWRTILNDRICTSAGYDLDPGEWLTVHRALPDSLSPATYRYEYKVGKWDNWELGDRVRQYHLTEYYTREFNIEKSSTTPN